MDANFEACKAFFWSRWCLINFLLQPRFAYKVGDGVCDQVLNNVKCCYDGNDCESFASECTQCPRDFVKILRLHKGKCLPSFNTPQCCYSLGACSNINECRYSAKLPLVHKFAEVTSGFGLISAPNILAMDISSQTFRLLSAHVRFGTADISTHGLYSTGLFRHRDISARGTFRHMDVSAPWTFRHMDVSARRTFRHVDISAPWTFRHVDISARWTFRHGDISAPDVSARVFSAHFRSETF